jgi:alanine dehydrogenase
MKIYTSSRDGLRFLVPLFDATSGALLALIEADYLGQMRTGAASGVATRLMARADARVVGIIGTGLQARPQLEAIAAVRKLERIRAFGRDIERRAKFAVEMTERLNVPVETTSTAEEAVRDVDIVVTATNASSPVVEGRWLAPGTHINAIGANFAQKRELDDETVRRADIIAVDSREQSKMEAGDLIHALNGDLAGWASIAELADLVAGRVVARADARQITLFKSNGIAIEDVVTAAKVYEQAIARGIGAHIRIWDEAT